MVVDLTNAFMSECAQIPRATFQNLVLTFPEEWRGDKICVNAHIFGMATDACDGQVSTLFWQDSVSVRQSE